MKTLLDSIRSLASDAIQKAFNIEEEVDVSPSTQEEFGHYQINSALKIAKFLKQNPIQVAQKIVDHLDHSFFSKVEIAGPGFINLTFSAPFLSKDLQTQLHDPLCGVPSPEKREKVIVEFSSPNVAKELHVGHIRSTIIGDSLARLFEFLGQDVLRLNHIGDWGTQFGMLIAYMKEFDEKKRTIDGLMQDYRAAKKKFDADPEFKKRAQLEVVKLQSGDIENLRIWEEICDISRAAFQEIYDLLDVKIIERGESYYNKDLTSIVSEFEAQGLVTISDGAKCIFLEGFQIPLIIQKSDGGYNYATTDLAALKQRILVEKADRIIYVVDVGQGLHLQMVFAAAKRIGWLDPKKTKVDHVGFGLVLGQDRKKFKTRSGETEKLIDLLQEAINQAKVIVQARLPETKEDEINHLAHVLGIGAVKYSDLSTHRTKDYVFSYEKMLRFEGNTAVFLLYAYVRINGIKRKSEKKIAKEDQIELSHQAEISLGVHLRRFGEVLELVSKDLLPNRLADYLYELAEKFNAFFRDCRVVGSDEEASRLQLCELTAKVLKQGLQILGLETVDSM